MSGIFNPTQGIGFAGLALLPNAKYVSLYKSVTATGNTDIYTVPAGKRALFGGLAIFNNSGGASTTGAFLKISATYYPLSSSSSQNNQTMQSRGFPACPYVAEAGEIAAVNVSAQPCVVNGVILEFDNTANLRSAKLTTVTVGDNTVYTVSAGKTALLVVSGGSPAATVGASFLNFMNISGGARTVAVNIVPSGGSVGATNKMVAGTSCANAASTALGASAIALNAGDFVSINTDANTAGQLPYVTVVEI